MMKKLLLGCILAATLATGCNPVAIGNYVKIKGFALGTSYSFILSDRDTTGVHDGIEKLFAELDNSMSVYNPNSLVSRLNANTTDSVDRHIARCIEVSRHLSELSGGAYDITVKPLTQALGFGRGPAQSDPNIDSLLQLVDYRKIRIENGRLIKDDPRIQIDLNSVAKGYIVDAFGQFMQNRGIEDYLIEIGGEIVCKGLNARGVEWTTGIDKPLDGNIIPGERLQDTISFTGAGMATSGDYRKFYYNDEGRKVGHIINALTALNDAPDPILSATVIAGDCATADAAATTFMIVGLERSIAILRQNPDWMALLIYDDGKGEAEFATYKTGNLLEKLASQR